MGGLPAVGSKWRSKRNGRVVRVIEVAVSTNGDHPPCACVEWYGSKWWARLNASGRVCGYEEVTE